MGRENIKQTVKSRITSRLMSSDSVGRVLLRMRIGERLTVKVSVVFVSSTFVCNLLAA